MNTRFKSGRQEALFNAVLRNLQQLGYRGELLRTDYAFVDWFQPDNPERVVPAAAFGQTPQSYDSACFAVLLSNGKFGPKLVADCRALGAPYAFEVRDDLIINWRVGPDAQGAKELLRIEPDQVDRIFQDHREPWAGGDILRTKGISYKLGPRQLDFIDLGLIPALEQQISSKLDRVLKELVQETVQMLKAKRRSNPEELRALYRLIFRFLAGKVLHDRDIPPFRSYDQGTPRRDILDAVAKYYGDHLTITPDRDVQDAVAAHIWTELDFRNLSVEVLAYIYENTFVDPEARRKLGTHSTPHSVARYIVHNIPFERLDQEHRQTLEPFSGHGVFLVAALQRLRELLPPAMDGKERHKYFVRMLKGFEIDQFALEVSRLCLMLADFPNHNGWKLSDQNIFKSEEFTSAVQHSRVILSNPPFEDFTEIEKKQYPPLSSLQKPVEFLYRVLENLPADGMIGIVLPRQFLDGRGYRGVREHLGTRFEELQLVALPDGIFENADMETVLLIGTEPRNRDDEHLRILFSQVKEADRHRFLTEYAYTRRDEAQKRTTDAETSLNVVQFQEVWERLRGHSRLGKVAEIHRGVEWEAPFDEEQLISLKPRSGFRRGLHQAKDVMAFEQPTPVYLSERAPFRRGRDFLRHAEGPKVFVNAARASRGPWAMVASVDTSGLLATQNFHGIWPEKAWTAGALAAVLNSPLANAFIATHEFKRHIRRQTLQALPLPNWRPEQMRTAEQLVSTYEEAVTARVSIAEAERALLAIDAFVLRGYALPPRMERHLLDLFHSVPWPVPFEFTGFFPPGFAPTIPLWMYLSDDFQNCSARYLLSKVPRITDPALIDALEEASE